MENGFEEIDLEAENAELRKRLKNGQVLAPAT